MTTESHTDSKKLTGPQTTGRVYKNLSQPEYEMVAEAIQPGEKVSYRIPLVANARRFKAGIA